MEATILLRVRGPEGERAVEAILDTGFDGWLSLPEALVRILGLERVRSSRAALADGTEVDLDVYDAEVEWHGGWRRIAVDEADTDPLVGMRLLRGSSVCPDVTEGGHVEILPLSE